MPLFPFILLAFLLGDLYWWRWTSRRLEGLRRSGLWRALLGAVASVQVGYLLLKFVGLIVDLPPMNVLLWHTLAYLWHILFLPAFITALLAVRAGGAIGRRLRPASPAPAAPADSSAAPSASTTASATASTTAPTTASTTASATAALSRRQALVATAAAFPVFAAGGMAAACMREMLDFRTVRIDLELPALPPDLDGLRIAHLSDLHIGQFLPNRMDQRVALATNALEADLVVFTGDLLDISAPKVQPGIDFLRQLDPRHGLALIEGNHDGMGRKAAGEFEDALKSAGLPLLLDQAVTYRVPGRTTPVQFLGQTWGSLKRGEELKRWGKEAGYRFRMRSDEATAQSMATLLGLRQAGSFPILLAHHPHTFEPAAAAGLPLTLAGHTHGGQLMVTPRWGVGPLRYRYWSGQYARGASRLFVNNGIGSWFPLRINAPAEIVLLTLRSPRGPQSATQRPVAVA